jgi:hypothetical protein
MDDNIKKTWKPTVAGSCNIAIGITILAILLMFTVSPIAREPFQEGILPFGLSMLFMIVPGLVIGTLAIVGGVFAIQRRRWRWALAGSIGASLVPVLLGILAIVLLVLSRNEFKRI